MTSFSSDPKQLMGSCACGASTWHSKQNATHLDYCYCTQCQQISGAPMVAWLGIPKPTLTFTGPMQNVTISPIAHRGFCGECGGTLILQYDCYPEKTHVAAGTVTRCDFELPKVGSHMFVRSKPRWHIIGEDGVARHEDFDPEFTRLFPEVVRGGSEKGMQA